MFKFIFRCVLLFVITCFGLYSYGCYNAKQAKLLRERQNKQLIEARQQSESQHWPTAPARLQVVAYPPSRKPQKEAPAPLLDFNKVTAVYSKATEDGLKKFQANTEDVSSNISLGWESLVSDLTNIKNDYNYLQEKFQTSLKAIDLLHKSLKQAKEQIDTQNKEIAQMRRQIHLSTRQPQNLRHQTDREPTHYVAIPHKPPTVPRGNMDYIIVNYNQ